MELPVFILKLVFTFVAGLISGVALIIWYWTGRH